jgi:diacylglycerol kinase (ATP)
LRVALMHNPSAGDEDHSAEALTRALRSEGHEVRYQSTDEDDWRQAFDDSLDLVAIAGGDGTLRDVFKLVADTGVPATVLPVGSANNIARALGFESDDTALLAGAWERARRRPYRLGLFSSNSLTEPFVEAVGGGIFAGLLERADQHDGDPGGDDKVRHGLRMLRETVPEAPALDWEVTVDGVDLSGQLLSAEVMNVAETGPNVPVSPDAQPGDGRLDLVLIRPEQRAELVRYLDARLAGRIVEPPRFVLRSGRRIELRPHEDCPLRLDDELISGHAIGSGTVTLDGSLEVLVPAALGSRT